MKMDKNIYGYNENIPVTEEEKEKMKERYPVQQVSEEEEYDHETTNVEELKTDVDELGVGEDTRERG